jgi:hypothetical protein
MTMDRIASPNLFPPAWNVFPAIAGVVAIAGMVDAITNSAGLIRSRFIGQKAPLKLKEIWAIRIRLQLAQRTRDLALFNLAIDSKLRGLFRKRRLRRICGGRGFAV